MAEPDNPTARIYLIDETTAKRTKTVSYVRQKSTITIEWLQKVAASQFQNRYAPGRLLKLYHGIGQGKTTIAHRLDNNDDVRRMVDNPPRNVLVSFLRPGNMNLLMDAPKITGIGKIRQTPEEPRILKKSDADVKSRSSVIIKTPPSQKISALNNLGTNKLSSAKRKAVDQLCLGTGCEGNGEQAGEGNAVEDNDSVRKKISFDEKQDQKKEGQRDDQEE